MPSAGERGLERSATVLFQGENFFPQVRMAAPTPGPDALPPARANEGAARGLHGQRLRRGDPRGNRGSQLVATELSQILSATSMTIPIPITNTASAMWS
jgi:hypothetical protein